MTTATATATDLTSDLARRLLAARTATLTACQSRSAADLAAAWRTCDALADAADAAVFERLTTADLSAIHTTAESIRQGAAYWQTATDAAREAVGDLIVSALLIADLAADALSGR